jgi:TolB-like protein/tetratricopeptide (TPR) repeat protein
MGSDQEGTLSSLQALRHEIVDPMIAEHHGRIVKTTGDGMLVEFASVVDAVRCAVEVQRGAIDHETETPDQRRIRFRIGINLGDIIADGDDIFGDGVNVAARLESLAEPGGICVSRMVRDQIRDKLPYPFEDMGEQSVKNIARPVHAYTMSANSVASTPLVTVPDKPSAPRRSASLRNAVVAASAIGVISLAIAVWWTWLKENLSTVAVQPPAATSPQIAPAVTSMPGPRLSIVVLPFANLSNDPDQEYFADGITDDLTTDISRISNSFVIAHNTALTYKGKPIDVRQVGRELNVRYVLEGSVRRAGDQVQVNAQLVDAETGVHLWADRFDTSRRNIPEAQNEITGRLARTLHLELGEAVGRRIEQEKVVDPDARDSVMRGWALFYRPFSVANRQEARRAFEEALEIDPRSIDARIGIALVLATNVGDGWSSSVEQDKARAEQLLLEALEGDANRSMAHYATGMLRRIQNRLAESRIEFETAIALDRNNARALYQLGSTLLWLGQPEAGIPYIEKAFRLNPHDPNRANFYASLGMCHLVLSHVDEAIDLLRKARAENPRLWFIHFWLAGGLGLKGDLDEARTALAESLRLKPEMNSLARRRADVPWVANPSYWALQEKSLNVGLRRAGFPDE